MTSSQATHWRRDDDADGIAWITLDKVNAGANTLSSDVLAAFLPILEELERTPPKAVIFRSGKKNGFIAGADIEEIGAVAEEEQAVHLCRSTQEMFDRLEALPCPTIALIHGFCLGGGMEFALACDHRIAMNDPATKLGLPEVKLGIHPGFGGTWRMPRLIGAIDGLTLMLTGRALKAKPAKHLGLVDAAPPRRQWEATARQFALTPPKRRQPPWWKRLPGSALLRPLTARLIRWQTAKKASPAHYPAPFALIDLWRRFSGDGATMQKEEADSLARLLFGSTAPELVRLFFLQERLKGLGKVDGFKPTRVHVVGAGTMGGDIAAWCALQGMTVTIQDMEIKRIAPAIKRAHGLFKKKLKARHQVQAALDRLIPDPKGWGVPKAEVIIEAIFENLEAKRKLFRDLELQAAPEAMLASNTSSIPLEEIAEVLEDPTRLIGLHFFNPVAKMMLIEVVAGAQSAKKWTDRGAAFTGAIKKLPLPVKSGPGFLVNRLLMPYLREAFQLAAEGVAPRAIDRAAVKFGMPMGPLALADAVGLDICQHVAEVLTKELGGQPVPGILADMTAHHHLGVKSGHGFYRYAKGKKSGGGKGQPLPEDGLERMLLPMLNEAAACLAEGIVADGDLLDAGMVFGTGFAPFLGGPMGYLKRQGPDAVRNRLGELEQLYGARFTPHPGWQELLFALRRQNVERNHERRPSGPHPPTHRPDPPRPSAGAGPSHPGEDRLPAV